MSPLGAGRAISPPTGIPPEPWRPFQGLVTLSLNRARTMKTRTTIGESFLKPDGARTDARDSLNGIPSRFLIEFILRPILICEVSRWLRDLAYSLSQTSRRPQDILGRRT